MSRAGNAPSRFTPPEVEFHATPCAHKSQKLAVRDDGQPFRQYLLCAGGCGYVIGCGDAIEEVWHNSCLERAGSRAGITTMKFDRYGPHSGGGQ